MPVNQVVYKIFLSSPSDLSEERKILKNYIDSLKIDNVKFQAVLWEEDLPAISTDDPQTEIDNMLLKPSDMLIGVFKSRFGNKTERFESGTVEEIEESIAFKKPVMMYFLDYNIETNKSNANDLKDALRINEFKEKYKRKGIYHTAKDIHEVVDKWLEIDIKANLDKIGNSSAKSALQKKTDKDNNAISNLMNDNQNDEWFKDSISEKINSFLNSKMLNYKYIDDLTFHENSLMAYNSKTNFMSSSVQKIMDQARVYAFNEKYGDYNYDGDLRSIYQEWYLDVQTIINKNFTGDILDNKVKILDVGSNYGKELIDIFPNNKANLYALDISDEAISKGGNLYNNKIKFCQGNMEEPLPFSFSFDICLCLRAIQSRGVFRQDALIQMASHVKKDGLIIISIPNGYVDKKKNILRGLYDHRSKSVLRDRPNHLANKICYKLLDYGFCDVKIYSGDTEIYIYGIKKE